MRRLPLVCLRTGFILMAGAAALSAAQGPQFRAASDTIPIYATVVDASGRLVTDLTRDDFEVRDNGRSQKLTTFENAARSITVVMMLDRSGSVEDQFAFVEQAAGEFVSQLGPDDRARIGSFSTEVRIDPPAFTSDHTALMNVLRNDLQPFGPTPLWNATGVAMTAVGGEQGRRVVLVFTDGKDLPLDGPNVTFAQIRHRAETEDIMVYAIGLGKECAALPAQTTNFPLSLASNLSPLPAFQGRGRGGSGRAGSGRSGPVRVPGRGGAGRPGGVPFPKPRLPGIPGIPPKPPTIFDPARPKEASSSCSKSAPDPNLRSLAEISGGGYFALRKSADLKATFARVADELHHQYLLAFVAPQRDGALHHLEVRVRRAGATVRARRGYVAPRDPAADEKRNNGAR